MQRPYVQALLILVLVLAVRLPFLNQAIQGDDVFYLYGAEHALIDPAHPTHAHYVSLGHMVDMRGHPHPPFDCWYLALLLVIFKDVSEVPFHAAYILFSLIAAFSALALARRFTNRPLAAVILFVATPAFVINGGSLESDIPFLAFWLASMALFVEAVERRSTQWLAACAFAMALATLSAYQAVVLIPILALYLFQHEKRWRAAWVVLLTPIFIVLAWQGFERVTSGSAPAAVLGGYMQTYGWQSGANKIKNAAALTGHLGWMVCPLLCFLAFRPRRNLAFAIAVLTTVAFWYDRNPLFWMSVAVGLMILFWCAKHARNFMAAWLVIFFAASLVLFFAGSARYLLPIALPLAILVSRRLSNGWLAIGAALGFALSLSLAIVNYQHWDGYRQFARRFEHQAQDGRVWINSEWGLRYYLESEGAVPLQIGQQVRPGQTIISSRLGWNPEGSHPSARIAEAQITSVLPLRLTSVNARSGYSSVAFGLRPFDISTKPMDTVRADVVRDATSHAELSDLPMNSPGAAEQIVSGIYGLEENRWRWMGAQATVLLKTPDTALPLRIHVFIPQASPARHITASIEGRVVADQTFSGPGEYTLSSAALQPASVTTTVTLWADKTFSVPGDTRQLSVVLTEIGFQ